MTDATDMREFPEGYQGRRRYVRAVNHGIIAACYAYSGFDGRYYVMGDTSGVAPRSGMSAPYVIGDIGEYQSPIDNSMVTSRSSHREHLKVYDVIEVGNERMPAPRPSFDAEGRVGDVLKQHIEKVKSMPDDTYLSHVEAQAAEHAAISNLITASV